MTKKIGIMVGRENTWPQAFIDEVNRRQAGVIAEFVRLDGTRMAEHSEYAVIVDRISHEVPYYRTFLKTAMMGGTYIINNPFWWSADEKFVGATICGKIGVAHPKTVALPSHSYIEGIVHPESLRNLSERIPWEEHVAYVGGFPVILKPSSGGGFKNVYKLHTMEQLWEAYNQTGTECMMLQEFIEWEKYARCFVIGREKVLVMKFDVSAPYPHRYFDEPDFFTWEEIERISADALKITRALGYDMNTCEFALRDGIPYAIDFTNPAPDMDYYSLKEKFFGWALEAMADLAIEKAHAAPVQYADMQWSVLLNGTQSAPAPVAAPASNKADRLVDINGIGPVFAKRLNEAGISSFAQLAATAPDRLREIVAAKDWQKIDPEAWIAEARQRA
jgi:predicted flap endonuclease-1-like 5' DNA nuclease